MLFFSFRWYIISVLKGNNMLGIYIHIPFCKNKCPYCDFVSFENKDPEAYIDAVLREIKIYGKYQAVDTVFFGGGTPTLIDPSYIDKIMTALRESFNLSKMAEITIEANPGTVDERSLKRYLSMGINRISFGLQSTFDDELKTLGRIHTIAEFEKSYMEARSVGFRNINIDLMFSLINQSEQRFFDSVDRVLTYAPEHISCYSLKIEEGTPYYNAYSDSKYFASEEAERNMYHYAHHTLEKNGYTHYETSNFAKEGKRCEHNLIYWKNEPYIGIGVAAHGYLKSEDEKHYRYSNVSDIDAYIRVLNKDRRPIDEKTVLSEKDILDEYLMLRLRLNSGINFFEFEEKFGIDFKDRYKVQIMTLEKNEMIRKDDFGIYPTLKGFDLQNTMITLFL